MKIVLLTIFLSASLFAHKLNVFVSQDKDNVVVSSYFASGSFCKNCKVEVYDRKNELLEEGKTDKNGEYIIKNLDSKIIVKVEASGGHGASNEFEVENLKPKEKIEETHNIWQSLIAAFLIGLIFVVLKRLKK